MAKRQKLNFPTEELAKDLKLSVKGKGLDAFFTPPPPAADFTEQRKNDTNNKDESGALIQPETLSQKDDSVKETGRASAQPKKTTDSKLQLVDNTIKKSVKKKQISAWILEEQYHKLRNIHFRLNDSEGKFDKSDLIGLAIETIAEMLGRSPTRLKNIIKAKEYIQKQMDKIFVT